MALSHAPVDKGGLGFVPLVDPPAALQRFILDPNYWRGWVPDAIQLFLNGEADSSPYARQKRKSGDIGSLWVDVKEHLAARGHKLTAEPVHTEGNVEVEMLLQLKLPHGPQSLTCKGTTRQFRQRIKLTEFERWKRIDKQSDVVRAISGGGSSFVSRGGGLSDAR
ncbi:hypothetical protein PI124_g7487 [Phytophthora idaei]|nr:hypothetical protein PI125_g7568 [Phytophthora idaei]KAG3123465.1 hypothetical protein PI126_g23696 [Phytophthora idaei]KAG3247836.1 hypothetical protein PI124_g7487 [Phytophthora idaei]